ncbi:hypothetical protein [Frigidibacter sp. ROC022]|uniref:hypothetical protein n=1 Tax=Frigidibacter sp. ROC022 TaxID=2971796 RepID=UPI00215B11B6|nr:hypothetical protein [Frigidibacter sp. ROC022]
MIWISLALAFTAALIEGRWSLAFVATATFVLTLLPMVLIHWAGIRMPVSFTVGIVLFIYATIFLGEAFDFYNRYWWWDIALHGGSALGFGMLGFLFIFMLFEGDRYAAPAWALALIACTVAVTIGVLWEIFEFLMDSYAGTNMQKSGLPDTMGDLIVDLAGGAFGGLVGYFYLLDRDLGGLSGGIRQFIADNARLFRRRR